MSDHRWWVGFMVVSLLVAACANNFDNLKKQAEGNRVLGEEYIRQEDYTAALKHLLLAETQFSEDAELHKDLGDAYRGKGRNDKAIFHYQKALQLDPKFSEAKNNLGVAYMEMGNWDAAILVFEELTEDLLYPTPHFPLFNLGWVYYNKQQYEQSEKYYRAALKISPDFIKALRGLGLTYMAMGRGGAAVKTLSEAIGIVPNAPQLFFDLAQAHLLTGNAPEARKAFAKILELNPADPLAAEARKALDRLR